MKNKIFDVFIVTRNEKIVWKQGFQTIYRFLVTLMSWTHLWASFNKTSMKMWKIKCLKSFLFLKSQAKKNNLTRMQRKTTEIRYQKPTALFRVKLFRWNSFLSTVLEFWDNFKDTLKVRNNKFFIRIKLYWKIVG